MPAAVRVSLAVSETPQKGHRSADFARMRPLHAGHRAMSRILCHTAVAPGGRAPAAAHEFEKTIPREPLLPIDHRPATVGASACSPTCEPRRNESRLSAAPPRAGFGSAADQRRLMSRDHHVWGGRTPSAIQMSPVALDTAVTSDLPSYDRLRRPAQDMPLPIAKSGGMSEIRRNAPVRQVSSPSSRPPPTARIT
jgi:hypothetical protein